MKLSGIFISSLAVIFILALPVHAHPGRTDADGGHMDHSTGEYHYHHSQPAHDHYDIDNDGSIDCPYDFKDGVTKNSISESSNQSSSFTKAGASEKDSKSFFDSFSYFSFCFMAPFIIIPLLNFSFFLSENNHNRMSIIAAICAGLIWFITFPISTFLVLGYFHYRKK